MKFLFVTFAAFFLLSCDSDDDAPAVGPAGKIAGVESTRVGPPTSLSVEFDYSAQAVTLRWGAPEDTDGYDGHFHIRYSYPNSNGFISRGVRDGSLSYRLVDVRSDVTYNWGVRTEGRTGYGNSDWVSDTFVFTNAPAAVEPEPEETQEEGTEAGSTSSDPVQEIREDINYYAGLPLVNQQGFRSTDDCPANYVLRSGRTSTGTKYQCFPDCESWESWNGTECVEACVGTGQLAGSLVWDGPNGSARCGCDHAAGYTRYTGSESGCGLIYVPPVSSVSSSSSSSSSSTPSTTACPADTRPKSLRAKVRTDHAANKGNNCYTNIDATAPTAYPWDHSHTVCNRWGTYHSHPIALKCGDSWPFQWINFSGSSAHCGVSWDHHTSDDNGFTHGIHRCGNCGGCTENDGHYHSYDDLGHHAGNCVMGSNHPHNHPDQAFEAVGDHHAHPPAAEHGTGWCYSNETATCGSDGTWSCQ